MSRVIGTPWCRRDTARRLAAKRTHTSISYLSVGLLQMDREILVPKVGVEPTWCQAPRDFESQTL